MKSSTVGLHVEGLSVNFNGGDVLSGGALEVMCGAAGSVRSAAASFTGLSISIPGDLQLTGGDQDLVASTITVGRITKESTYSGNLHLKPLTVEAVGTGLATVGAIRLLAPSAALTIDMPLSLSEDLSCTGELKAAWGVALTGSHPQNIESVSSTVTMNPAAPTLALTKTLDGEVSIHGAAITLSDFSSTPMVNLYGPATVGSGVLGNGLRFYNQASIAGDINCGGDLTADADVVLVGTVPQDLVAATTISVAGSVLKDATTNVGLELRALNTIVGGKVSAGGSVAISGQASVGGDITSANAHVTLNDGVTLSGAGLQTISAGGDIRSSLLSKPAMGLTLSSPRPLHLGGATVQGNLYLNAPSSIVAGDLIAMGDLTMDGGMTLSRGTQTTGMAQSVSAVGRLNVPGTVTKAFGDLTLSGMPAVFLSTVTTSSGALTVQGMLESHATMTASGLLQIQMGSISGDLVGGSVSITGECTFINIGKQTVTANVGTLAASKLSKPHEELVLKSEGGMVLSGSVVVAAGKLTLAGKGQCEIGGAVVSASDELVASDVSFTATTNQSISAASLSLKNVHKSGSGTLSVQAATSIIVAGEVDATQGSLLFGASSMDSSPTLTFASDVRAMEGDVTFTVPAVLSSASSQTLAAGPGAELSGAEITKAQGDLNLAGAQIRLLGGSRGGSLSAGAALNLNGVLKTDLTRVSAGAAAHFTSADFSAAGAQTVEGSSISFTGPVMKALGSLSLQALGGGVQVDGDVILGEGNVTMTGATVLGGNLNADWASITGDLTLPSSSMQWLLTKLGLRLGGGVSKSMGEVRVKGVNLYFVGSVALPAAYIQGHAFISSPNFESSAGDLSFLEGVTVSGGAAQRIDATGGRLHIEGMVRRAGVGKLSLGGLSGVFLGDNVVSDSSVVVEDPLTCVGNFSVMGTLSFFSSVFLTGHGEQNVASTGLLQCLANFTKLAGPLSIGTNTASRAQFNAWIMVWGGALTLKGSVVCGGSIYGQKGITLDTCVLNAPGPQIVDAWDGCLVVRVSIEKSASSLFLGGRQCITLTKTSAPAGSLNFYDEFSGPQPACPAQCKDGINKNVARGPAPPIPEEPTASPSPSPSAAPSSASPTSHPTTTPTTLAPSLHSSSPTPASAVSGAPTPHGGSGAPTATHGSKAPSMPPTGSGQDGAKPSGLGAGTLAAIIVLSLLVVGGVGMAVFCWRRRRAEQRTDHVLLSEDVGGYRAPDI